jgi:hypothetical protein
MSSNGNSSHHELPPNEKENELYQKTLLETETQWFKRLDEEKLETLKKEAVKLQRQFEKEVNDKTELIQTSMNTIDNAEAQFRLSVATHFQSIDDMIQMHDAALCRMEHEFHDKLDRIKYEYATEKQIIVTKFEQDKEQIMNETKVIEIEEKELIDEHNREQQQAIEEIKNKNQEDENGLRFALDTRIEDLDEQFEIAKNEYLQKTDTQSEALQKELETEKEVSKEMTALQSQIDSLSSSIKRSRSTSKRKSSQNEEARKRVLQRKNDIIRKYSETRAMIENLRSTQHEKLKELTRQANLCKSDLEKEFELVERILKFIQLTKKMKIEQADTASAQEQEDETTTPMEYEQPSSFDAEGIWRRYNNALLDMHTLKNEEQKLMRKNTALRAKLQKFQDGVTINDRVISDNNPLIVINGKMTPKSFTLTSTSSSSSLSSKKKDSYCLSMKALSIT